ncbi:MAG: capsular biosynthesis protein [Clostridia bacterium]|nr:capsular biosynthesis protein [Clostridia bacterium]
MIDIHAHILPQIDDGAQSKTMAFEMCEMAARSGVTDIIATPHMMDLYASDEFSEKVNVRVDFMNRLMEEKGIALRIHKGAEVFASGDILFSPDLHPFTLAGSRYLLFEFDFGEATLNFAKEVAGIILSQDLIPVLAHPERYRFTLSNYENINRLADCGVLFQCNIGSLTGELGKKEAVLAREMLNAGAVSFLGSDAHRVKFRNTDIRGMLSSIKEGKKKVDYAKIEPLLTENPAKLLRGEHVENPSFATLKKKLF